MKKTIKELQGILCSALSVFYLLSAIFSAAVFLSLILSNVMEPRWVAPGYPSFYKYPKSIEFKSIVLSLPAAIFISILFSYVKSNLRRALISLPLLVLALFLISDHLRFQVIGDWVVPALTLLVLLSLLHYLLGRYDGLGPDKNANYFFVGIAGIIGSVYFFFFNLVILTSTHFDNKLDLHHLGEEFTSAVDFLNSGKPFISFFWPHGFHDSGIIAFAFYIASKADIPTLLIAKSATYSIGAFTLLLLAIGLGLGNYSILILFSILLVNLVLPSTFGLLIFVVISFLLFSKTQKPAVILFSGAIAFIAYIYRIDYGIYGVLSVAALFAHRTATSFIIRDISVFKKSAFHFTLFLSGFVLAAILSFMIFGWPNAKWYDITLFILPKYMLDSTGLPYPLPMNWLINYPEAGLAKGTFYLLAVFGLLAVVSQYLYKNLKKPNSVNDFFLLVVFYVIFSMRTALGRSAEDHIMQFFGFAYLLIALIISRVLVSSGLNTFLKAGSVVILFSTLNYFDGKFTLPSIPSFKPVLENGVQLLSEYNEMPPQQCSNNIFSQRALENPNFVYYDEAICSLRATLSSLNINDKELLVSHSASLVYSSLGFSLPTKYYCLGWAITEDMQRELISELEDSGIKAILIIKKTDGLLAITTYDIPDSARLPVYYDWVTRNFDIENPIPTPIGSLILKKHVF